MTDYAFYSSRREKFRTRLKAEMDRVGLKQDGLADRLGEELGVRPGQPTVSDWVMGRAFPRIDTLFALSRVLGCDCGYLLGDYDERTHGAAEIRRRTGLSESTVNTLCNLAAWRAEKELSTVIDALTFDLNYGTRGEVREPLVYLIYWYLGYAGSQKKRIQITGEITETSDTTGYLGGSLILDSSLVENAALMKILQGLTSLKARTKGENDGQH